MKNPLLCKSSAALAALLSFATRAEAHPGHSAFDWFSAAPHAGHETEYAVLFAVTALTALGFGLHRLFTRKR